MKYKHRETTIISLRAPVLELTESRQTELTLNNILHGNGFSFSRNVVNNLDNLIKFIISLWIV